jgi:hypothetical protein
MVLWSTPRFGLRVAWSGGTDASGDRRLDGSDVIGYLNDAGANGWELVGMAAAAPDHFREDPRS